MLHKYAFLMFLALKIGSVFGVDAEAPLSDEKYIQAYKAFEKADRETSTRVQSINEGLKDNQHYNNCQDVGNTDNLVRSILAGLYLRKSVLKLGFDELESVVTANDEFFKTRLGVSLIYGWTLSQYQEHITPYYIRKFFSFKKHFAGLVGGTGLDEDTKNFLSKRLDLGWKAVEEDRWAFYFDHMLWLHSAIDRVQEDEQKDRNIVDATESDGSLVADDGTKSVSSVKKTVSLSQETLSPFRNITKQKEESAELVKLGLLHKDQTCGKDFSEAEINKLVDDISKAKTSATDSPLTSPIAAADGAASEVTSSTSPSAGDAGVAATASVPVFDKEKLEKELENLLKKKVGNAKNAKPLRQSFASAPNDLFKSLIECIIQLNYQEILTKFKGQKKEVYTKSCTALILAKLKNKNCVDSKATEIPASKKYKSILDDLVQKYYDKISQ